MITDNHSQDRFYTHIIMRKNQCFIYAFHPSIPCIKPFLIFLHRILELLPTTPNNGSCFSLLIGFNDGHNASRPRDPLFPVTPNNGPPLPLPFFQLDPFMQFFQPLGNMTGCFWDFDIMPGKCPRREEFLKPTVQECAQETRTNPFAGQTA